MAFDMQGLHNYTIYTSIILCAGIPLEPCDKLSSVSVVAFPLGAHLSDEFPEELGTRVNMHYAERSPEKLRSAEFEIELGDGFCVKSIRYVCYIYLIYPIL